MVTRAEKISQFKAKVRRSEAHAMCDELNAGHCTCRLNATGPCSTLLWPLRNSWGIGADAAQVERAKMHFNRLNNSFITIFSDSLT